MSYQVALYIIYFSGLLPVLYYRLSGAYKNEEISYAGPFIWLIGFASLYEPIVTTMLRVDSRIWFRVYTLLEILAIYYFFRKLFKYKYRRLINVFLFSYLAIFVWLLGWGFVMKNYANNSYNLVVELIFVFTCTFIWLKDLFSDMKLESLWQSPTFYILSGFILYFSGTLIFFLMTDLVFTIREARKYSIINMALSFFLHLILLLAIWKGQKKSIPYSGSQLQ